MSAPLILTLNAGSSSVKFSIYGSAAEPALLAGGQVESLGPASRLRFQPAGAAETEREIGAADHSVALQEIIGAAQTVIGARPVVGVGHRIVHGGIDFTEPTRLTAPVLAKLAALNPLAPLHQPHNLSAVAAAARAFPDALQLGCFDTAFHRGHDWVNDTFALPRHYYEEGVRRYGFHGLSYDYVTSALARAEPDLAAGRVIIAHLGNGASMCAIRAGKSVASTMGFSALDGLAMGTRSGQLDPGVILYLLEGRGMSVGEVTALLYKESGLKGLSGLSHDMRRLEGSSEPAAGEAIAYYVHRIRREIGALTACLGGLDALVFTGGIGENSAHIRAEVCRGMGWLGLALDPDANRSGAGALEAGAVAIRVIPTDEERVIARAVSHTLSAHAVAPSAALR